eukprot:gene26575-18342_t
MGAGVPRGSSTPSLLTRNHEISWISYVLGRGAGRRPRGGSVLSPYAGLNAKLVYFLTLSVPSPSGNPKYCRTVGVGAKLLVACDTDTPDPGPIGNPKYCRTVGVGAKLLVACDTDTPDPNPMFALTARTSPTDLFSNGSLSPFYLTFRPIISTPLAKFAVSPSSTYGLAEFDPQKGDECGGEIWSSQGMCNVVLKILGVRWSDGSVADAYCKIGNVEEMYYKAPPTTPHPQEMYNKGMCNTTDLEMYNKGIGNTTDLLPCDHTLAAAAAATAAAAFGYNLK